MRNRIGSFFLLALFIAGCIPSTIQQTSSIRPANGVAIPSHVMRIAVVAFHDSREDREEFPNLMTELQEKIIHGLVLKQVDVIDRKNMQTILKEKALGQSGILDQSEIQSVGKILGVDAILVGEVMDYGKIITPVAKLDLVCRLIDVKSGRILFSLQVNARKTNMQYPFELHREVIEEAVQQTIDAIR
jgi:curli biogenesis system outer membrane secretion channel CsgG